METQKTVNLLNSSENEYSKFETKKWHVIVNETKGNYSHISPIKFLTSISDYSDVHMFYLQEMLLL